MIQEVFTWNFEKHRPTHTLKSYLNDLIQKNYDIITVVPIKYSSGLYTSNIPSEIIKADVVCIPKKEK